MLIELLRAGTPDLARRWVAALLLVPESERASVVNAVEMRIVSEYSTPTLQFRSDGTAPEDDAEDPMMHVASPPVVKDGHTEQIIRSYSAPKPRTKRRPDSSSDAKRA